MSVPDVSPLVAALQALLNPSMVDEALELGVATKSGWSFMELGLSRIAASALEPAFPNSNLSVQDARSWLAGVDVRSLGLSSVIVKALKKLNLVQMAA